MSVPYVLKEAVLGTEHQDAALDLLYRMLGDPLREVRQRAAFFLVNGFNDNPGTDSREYVAKIEPHLARMTGLLEGPPFDLSIAETLAMFFEKFWEYAPDAALAYLEKAAGEHGEAVASEPPVAESAVNALAGLLQYHSLGDGEWRRCIDVLDALAAAGWPAALDMLEEAGSSD